MCPSFCLPEPSPLARPFSPVVWKSHMLSGKKVARKLARKKVISIRYYPHAWAARVHKTGEL
jgi:hypothetical protein